MYADALAFNPQGLDKLRFLARESGKDAVRAAAQEFEGYFLQLMLRSMRQTLAQDGPFDSQETRMFSEMFDQQIAQKIAQGRGFGLADMIVAQVQASVSAAPSTQVSPRPDDLPMAPVSKNRLPEAASGTAAAAAPLEATDTEGYANDEKPLTPANFVDRLWPHAAHAAAELGVSPHLLLAQAALETGWGRYVLRNAEGGSSHNLFNIKAGKGWTGERVAVAADEYVRGQRVTEQAEFRVYGSYAEAFDDYVRLLKANPRYALVLNQGGDAQAFARGLQAAGYATDLGYADKILRVLNSTAFRARLMAEGALA